MFRFLRLLSLLMLLAACAGDPRSAPAVGAPERITQAAVSPQSPASDAPSFKSFDPALRPLQSALDEYRRIEATGGWPVLPAGPKLELGALGERVTILRQRLIASGDLPNAAFDPGSFDSELAAAVRGFQTRHGLRIDGIVGPETTAALNVPVTQRVAMIRLNLTRMANEKRDWGPRYVAVNIPSASYRLVEGGQTALEGPAIVGRPSWPTPRLDSFIKRLEFNPYWTVPPRIARLELWPKIRRDVSYLARNNMHIIDGQIRQNPGPGNPLGVVKFIFDNPYNVYLHDTNNRNLFERPKRFLSHGCMRVSHAIELAKQLLKADPNRPEQRIDEAIASGRNIRVDLIRTIPIHVVYDTAWVDDAGIVQFRDDIYGLDHASLAIRTSGANTAFPSCGVGH